MADGVSFSSLKLSSDQTFDFLCTPCERDHKHQEAVTYCTECREYFCTTCIDFHNRFSATRRHTAALVGKERLHDIRASTAVSGDITVTCESHRKLADMYCHNDERLGCSTCIDLDHR